MATPTIGILGAGQLGRMIALAGIPLGIQFRFYDPAPNGPAARLGAQTTAAYNDLQALQQFANGLDLITYEFENVPLEAAAFLQQFTPVYPPPAALAAAQDRLHEKQFFQQLAIPTAPFVAVTKRTDLDQALQQLGLPVILKTRRMGYDGKGQYLIRRMQDAELAWQALGGQALICEGLVAFERELSVLAVRNRAGETQCYPLVENLHHEGILRRSLAPAPRIEAILQQHAEQYALAALAALEYVGVLAIELFQAGQQLVVNEMAPRVHNSGHWTIEGAETSQFENHVRAVLGLPLGSTAARGPNTMFNLIGALPELRQILAIPGAHVHLYEKEPRPGRKIGHVTLCGAAAHAAWEGLAATDG
jgi:5-(carboxyamino)imidazole ribonucleotide synthase